MQGTLPLSGEKNTILHLTLNFWYVTRCTILQGPNKQERCFSYSVCESHRMSCVNVGITCGIKALLIEITWEFRNA